MFNENTKLKFIAFFAVSITFCMPAQAAAFDITSIKNFVSKHEYKCFALIGAIVGFGATAVIRGAIANHTALSNDEQQIFDELTSLPKIPKHMGIPDFISKHCNQPIGFLPHHIQKVAQEAMKALGLSNVFFFQTNYRASHASSRCFAKIGLRNNYKLFEILCPDAKPAYFLLADGSKIINPNITENAKFELLRILYHELIHIRGRHSFGPITRRKVHEMEAELGAAYYSAVFNDVGIRFAKRYSCEDDGEHPVHEEQCRYNNELMRQLYINDRQLLIEARKDPNAYFNTIVSRLVEQYAEEKRTGIPLEFPNFSGFERVALMCGIPTPSSSSDPAIDMSSASCSTSDPSAPASSSC